MQHETELMRNYLLGELSEPEQNEVEERFFSDNEYFEQLLMTESMLLDEYASGELYEGLRKLVEVRLLGSEGQRKELNFTRHLLNGISQAKLDAGSSVYEVHPEEEKWAWLWAWFESPIIPASFALCLLLLLLSSSLLLWNRGLRRTVQRLEADRASLQEELERSTDQIAKEGVRPENPGERQDHQKPRVQEANGLVASLLLTSDNVVRGGGQSPSKTKIGSGVRSVRIQVELGKKPGGSTYQVTIKTIEGGGVWKGVVRSRGNQGDRLRFEVPAELVPPGDYILTITESGVDLNDYSFSVRR